MTEPAPLHLVAPCGLDCSRCVNCSEGQIAAHAKAIRDILGPNFAPFAERLAAMNPALAEYPAFARVLDALAEGTCPGCKTERRTCLPTCKVAGCAAARGLDFCADCADYPCVDTGLPPRLEQKWRACNDHIRAAGRDAFLRALAETPRYL
ncbi:DUF3795 domain-containing protein [Nitratidesulfovibrio sp. HK-II]|uniref:DUF3795 domain-containing protein n=1 Tax=Nitratidesulfovibrio sp. HK-II TaxID=2009266 RepID=UPI000E2F75DA|nr:DUF3795 domain-containing protein [Nitratidesulfovibrio sp. HK-II]GBO96827.1 hypothetical protein RVX_1866 [Nitratidesulfovibrio sp. HK-II]